MGLSGPDIGEIQTAVLQNDKARVEVLNLGCITQSWRLATGPQRKSVVLGYADVADYLNNPHYMGALVGRVANRIAGGRFVLNGKAVVLDQNEGAQTLHGGSGGLSTKTWQLERDGLRAVRLHLRSPGGDQGFVGDVDFEVIISLSGFTLTYDMTARVSEPTPINLAQHSYYNLAGEGDIWDHQLRLSTDRYTPVSQDGIPVGAFAMVKGSDADFRGARQLAEADPDRTGIDRSFCLHGPAPQARLSVSGGLVMEICTDQPALQVYTAAKLAQGGQALDGQRHGPFAGICLEPQGFPNAVNTTAFPSVIVTPDAPYRQTLQIKIAPESE